MFDDYKLSWEACVALLAISTNFKMSRVRDFAVKAIATRKGVKDTVTIINLAMEFDIQEWLAPAYAELCYRKKALTAEEGQLLGWETFAKLTEAREKYLQAECSREPSTESPSTSKFSFQSPNGESIASPTVSITPY
jgi:hypothetical protein